MSSGLETASREELLALIGVLQDQNTHLREQVAELKADNERLRDRSEQVRAFADRPEHVPFTNNLAERGLRPVKTQVKVSGCHQSEEGATAWLSVRSYIDSARKHGLSAFDALRRAFTGDLWMPPIPASA